MQAICMSVGSGADVQILERWCRVTVSGSIPAGDAFEHGEMAHHDVGGGGMPTIVTGRRPHGVAGTHANDGAVAGDNEPAVVAPRDVIPAEQFGRNRHRTSPPGRGHNVHHA